MGLSGLVTCSTQWKQHSPRSTRPQGVTGLPRVAGFCDSSLVAMCICIYVVWEMSETSASSRLLLGKCRVAPLLGMTIPRGELQSLVILNRLLLVVVEAMPSRVKSISTFTDSLCSIGALEKSSGTLRPYFANRVAEIRQIRSQLQEFTDSLNPVQHIPGTTNPAGLGDTRQCGCG